MSGTFFLFIYPYPSQRKNSLRRCAILSHQEPFIPSIGIKTNDGIQVQPPTTD